MSDVGPAKKFCDDINTEINHYKSVISTAEGRIGKLFERAETELDNAKSLLNEKGDQPRLNRIVSRNIFFASFKMAGRLHTYVNAMHTYLQSRIEDYKNFCRNDVGTTQVDLPNPDLLAPTTFNNKYENFEHLRAKYPKADPKIEGNKELLDRAQKAFASAQPAQSAPPAQHPPNPFLAQAQALRRNAVHFTDSEHHNHTLTTAPDGTHEVSINFGKIADFNHHGNGQFSFRDCHSGQHWGFQTTNNRDMHRVIHAMGGHLQHGGHVPSHTRLDKNCTFVITPLYVYC